MAAWPATLPAPAIDGYGIAPVDRVARSSLPGKRQARARFASAPATLPVRWRMTQAEFAVFEAWFRHIALDGAAEFTVPVANGQGVGTATACFADDWRADASPGLGFDVSATLFVRAMPVA